jgi:cell division FtsZ-interacting protein ZapD
METKMKIEEDLAALRAELTKTRTELAALREAHARMLERLEALGDAYSLTCEAHRISCILAEDVLIAIVRASRAVVDGFPDNFDSALIERIRQREESETPSTAYFDEIATLSDSFGCSDDVRRRSAGG